jgi:hypothetical protein
MQEDVNFDEASFEKRNRPSRRRDFGGRRTQQDDPYGSPSLAAAKP